jgi:hypothetical protein
LTLELDDRELQFDRDSTDDRQTFLKHDEQMKAFRKSHDSITVANSTKYSKLCILENTGHLRLHPIMKETGGMRLVNGMDDWSILVAALEVTRHKFWQN